MKSLKFLVLAVSFVLSACSVSVRTGADKAAEAAKLSASSDIVELTFLQLNDVYEIAPVENGKYGGMARVAAVRQNLLKENPNIFTVLAGDFISPSAIGTATFEGKRINGAQMIDAMNSVGVDFVTFGNHEFDLGYEVLQDRINQSKFMWISSNIQYTPSQEGFVAPFEKVVNGVAQPLPESHIIRAKNSAGMEVRVGIFGLTIGSNQPPYVVWTDPFESAQRVYADLKTKTDIVIALTHLSIEEDRRLAELIPDLKLILGGHEHTNMMFKVGETFISKADANARTVYIHRLRWSASTKSLSILSEVRTIDSTIPDELSTANIVNEWTARAYKGFQERGFDPAEVVTTLREPLDGRESSIRYRQTNLGSLVAQSMRASASKSGIAIFNSGSIRLDDQLAGTVTQYDIIRTLPFGGKLVEVEMKGSLLKRVLDAGQKNVGRGGFLQYDGVAFDTAQRAWVVGGKAIDLNARYWVIVSDFLFSGRETGIEFFHKDDRDVVSIAEHNPSNANDMRKDIRLAVIAFLKSN